MTRILTLIALLFAATAPSPTRAQTYPDRMAPGVNDFARIIDDATQARLTDQLARINTDEGVEIAIVTLSSLQFYANDSTIEAYSTGLFNAWGLGDVDTNTGLLMLIFRDDREVRIENGTGFGADSNFAIQQVIQQDIIPYFRDEDYAAGIEAGVDGLVSRVLSTRAPTTDTPMTDAPTTATVPATTAPEDGGSSNTLYYVLGGVAAAIAGLIGLNRRNAAKLAAQPCSSCGKTGLTKSREMLQEPTLEQEGKGETRITCPHCGHIDATPYTISKLKPEAPKEGGKSEGAGATGKW